MAPLGCCRSSHAAHDTPPSSKLSRCVIPAPHGGGGARASLLGAAAACCSRATISASASESSRSIAELHLCVVTAFSHRLDREWQERNQLQQVNCSREWQEAHRARALEIVA